jgi:hypothetical protein
MQSAQQLWLSCSPITNVYLICTVPVPDPNCDCYADTRAFAVRSARQWMRHAGICSARQRLRQVLTKVHQMKQWKTDAHSCHCTWFIRSTEHASYLSNRWKSKQTKGNFQKLTIQCQNKGKCTEPKVAEEDTTLLSITLKRYVWS